MFNFFKRKKQSTLMPEFLPFDTDIHSHILPGIDDGSPDIETSLQLIEGLYYAGIRKSIATPHIIGDLYRNTPEIINTALQQLKKACKEKGFAFEITAAAEYMLDDYFMELLKKNEPLLTLHKNIILTEIPYSSAPENLDEIVAAIKEKGYQPILAHPERYHFCQQNLDTIYELIELGFILQVNLLSITGYYGNKAQKAVKFIFDNNLTNLVGTDLHHKKHLEHINTPKNRKIFYQYLEGRVINNFEEITKNKA